MIYTISSTIFSNNSDENIESLNQLWVNTNGRHFLYIGSNNEYEIIIKSTWYNNLSRIGRDNLHYFYAESINKKKRDVQLSISSEAEEFSLIEAAAILIPPLTLILENVENDKHFLFAIIRTFKKLGKLINEHYENNWLVLANGGGSTIPNLVNEFKSRFDKDKIKFPKPSSVYLRIFVLVDSDLNFPSDVLKKNDKTKIVETIEANNLPHWITKKREMENYMPDDVIRTVPRNEDYIRAYLSLSEVQKDYFDIEKGFPDVDFSSLKPEIQELYSDIKPESYSIFRKMKFNFYEDNKKVSFKSNFPRLFNSHLVIGETLNARANSDELTLILSKIRECL